MGQKVNPISLRLQQTNKHFDYCWFDDLNYSNIVNRDLKIQSYINNILKQIKYCSARFFIQNLPNKIKINVFFLNPKNLRKNTSRAFQLKQLPNTKQGKNKIGRKNTRITNTQVKLIRKNLFLQNFKKQTNKQAELLNYLVLNRTNTSCIVPLEYKKKLDFTNKNKVRVTQNKINIFLRYLLLKNFSLKPVFLPMEEKQAKSFLFSNLINFKILDNTNKLFLVTNFVKNKIYAHEKNLQENIVKINLPFSSLSKKNYWKNPENSLFMVNCLVEKKNKLLALPLPLSLSDSLNKEKKIEEKKLHFLNLLCPEKKGATSTFLASMNTSPDKKDYTFLSLLNNESLKKTHTNFNKILKINSNFKSYNNSSESFQENYKNNDKKVLLLHNSSYKKHLESNLSNALFCNVVLSFTRFSNEKQSAIFLAEEIIYYLEKRVPFFKIKNQILREITKNSFLKGLRITCSGRVGGRSKKAQRSKVQIIKYGQTCLHVFSSKIDFASKHAYTAFGLLGIKVWICYN